MTPEKTIDYTFANINVLGESITQSGSTTTKEYINGIGTDNLIAYELEGVRYYYHTDHLGSVVGITDNSGSLVTEYEYDAYGNFSQSGSEVGNTRLYTGREYDAEIELYYLRARYYSSKLGRFIGRDPIDIADDVNLYAYVGDSPMMGVDLMGLACGKVLIMYSPNHGWDKFDTKISSMNFRAELIKQGYKSDNILLKYVEKSSDFIDDVNNFVEGYDSGEIVYLGHNEGWLSKNMTDGEILKLPYIGTNNYSMGLLTCKSVADGPDFVNSKNQIAQKIANQLGISVQGSTEDVNFSDNNYSLVTGSWRTVVPGGKVYKYKEKSFFREYILPETY